MPIRPFVSSKLMGLHNKDEFGHRQLGFHIHLQTIHNSRSNAHLIIQMQKENVAISSISKATLAPHFAKYCEISLFFKRKSFKFVHGRHFLRQKRFEITSNRSFLLGKCSILIHWNGLISHYEKRNPSKMSVSYEQNWTHILDFSLSQQLHFEATSRSLFEIHMLDFPLFTESLNFNIKCEA